MKAGTIVQCTYRQEHGHTGCILPSYHPLAWGDTLRDPKGKKTQEDIIRECPWTLDQDRLNNPQEKVPVAWCFGHVYWEKLESLQAIPEKEAKPFILPEAIYIDGFFPQFTDIQWPDLYYVTWISENPPLFQIPHKEKPRKTFSTEGLPTFKDLRFLNNVKERHALSQLEDTLIQFAA